MPEHSVILQRVIIQRTERPDGLRIWSDGAVQRTTNDNPLPALTDRLDKDRDLNWLDVQRLSAYQVDLVRSAIRNSGIYDLEPVLLINYCKEDPGTAIWTVDLGGETARIVVFDPRPRRSPEIDKLTQSIDAILTQ